MAMRRALLFLTLLRFPLPSYAEGLFGPSQVSVSVPKHYVKQRALPFSTPPLLSSTDETYSISLKQSEYSKAFSIRPHSIRAGQQFDIFVEDVQVLSKTNRITLEVVAESETSHERGGFEVLITVEEDGPQQLFTRSEYSFEIPLKFKTAPVGILKLIDGYSAENLHFSLFGSMSKYFALEAKHDGSLELQSLDCLAECSRFPRSFALVVRAVTTDSLRAYDAPISMRLKQGQGYPPKFKQSVFALNLRERSIIEDALMLEAEDVDSETLLYSLGSHEAVFELDRDFGVLSIIDSEGLTIDKLGEHFNVTVNVADEAGNVDSAVVMVSLEPRFGETFSAPAFSQEIYAFAAQPGVKFVGQLKADVLNGKITYRISEGGAKLFSINETDGRIFYEGPLEKNAHNYTLKVLALDDSAPSKLDVAVVQILIAGLESTPPKFVDNETLTVTINNDVPPGTFLYRFLASDEDPNAKLSYSLDSVSAVDEIGNPVANPDDFLAYFYFENQSADSGSLLLAKNFVNTSLLALHLTVKVTDLSHASEPNDKASLVIRLVMPEKKVSEHDLLQFPAIPEVVTVPEDIPIGSYIYTVNIKLIPTHLLKSYRITYTLSEGHRLFAINSVTGIITTISSLRLSGTSTVSIVANMMETQTSTMIVLKVRATPARQRNTPQFAAESFVFNVTENVPIGSVINDSIGAKAGEGLSYSIQGRDASYLSIDEKGVLRTAKNIDREENSQLAAFVRASHPSGQFSLTPVILNVLDEDDTEPKFPKRSYVATVMENSPVNTFIIRAQAYDGDNSELDYSLMMNTDSANLSSLLRVDQMGTVYNVEPLLGFDGDYQFAIIARDRRHSGASATIFLTVVPYTKCQPVFSQDTPNVFQINENEPVPTKITQFTAQVPSPECPLRYAIWDGNSYVNQTDVFALDSVSGELSAVVSFDHEVADRYALMIVAQSGDLFEQFDIEVRVNDLDDNQIEIIDKYLHYNIREDEKPGKTVGKIRAIDRDPIDKVYFHMLDQSGKFAVDTASGVLNLVDELDRETQDSYTLRVLVSNQEVIFSTELESDSATAVVKIDVIDVNDNGPVFERSLYTKVMHRNSLAGTKLLTVKAKDPDLPNQDPASTTTVLYRVDETVYRYLDKTRQANGFITVDEKTGEVSLGRSPRDFNGGVFESKIASSDVTGTEAHLAYTKLKVWLYDSLNVVELELDQNPKDLNVSTLEQQIKQLSDLTGCGVNLLGIRHLKLGDRYLRQPFRVQFVIINDTTDTLLTAEEAIALVDRHALDPHTYKPRLLTYQQVSNPAENQSAIASKSGEITLLLGVFLSLLALVSIIFGLVLCYHRSKFLKAKRVYEDEKIAIGTLNKNNRYKQPPPVILPPKDNLWEKQTISPSDSLYGTQEVVMSVEAESPSKRVRYSGGRIHTTS